MRTGYLASVALLLPVSALAGHFGEGYSSAEKGAPSDIYYRAFTIYTQQEACAISARPAELRVFPSPLILKVGDRIHRTNVEMNPGDLIVEAYAEDGEFLPAVPIIVYTIDRQNVVSARSDWDYLEAMREGEDELVVAWACGSADGPPLEARVRLVVTADDSPIN